MSRERENIHQTCDVKRKKIQQDSALEIKRLLGVLSAHMLLNLNTCLQLFGNNADGQLEIIRT